MLLCGVDDPSTHARTPALLAIWTVVSSVIFVLIMLNTHARTPTPTHTRTHNGCRAHTGRRACDSAHPFMRAFRAAAGEGRGTSGCRWARG